MLYLALVSVLWAFSFGLIGSILSDLDSSLVATLRLGCASLLFIPFLKSKKITKIDRLKLFICGFIQFGLMYVSYIKAFHYLPSHLVAVFSILTPLYVILIYDLLNRSLSPRYLLAAFLSVLGAASIQIDGIPEKDIWIGFGLMQISGICFAFGQVYYRGWKLRNFHVKDSEVYGLLALGGTICAVGFCTYSNEWNVLEISSEEWQAIGYLGFVATGLGFFLWNKGAALCNAGTLAVFNNALVPLAVLCSLFVFGEIENSSSIEMIHLFIGTCLIMIALGISRKKRPLIKKSSRT